MRVGAVSAALPLTAAPSASDAIPAVTWRTPIGQAYARPGHPRVSYPMVDDGPWAGVPLGGLGAGSIGRTQRGDFARWHLDIGRHHVHSVPANQFAVFVGQGGQTQAHVLSTIRPDALPAWNWDLPEGAGTYHGLFPKAWFDYDWPALGVRLTQKQFSPVIPGNYQESSYPVGVFEWRVENPTDAPLTVGLMFTWQNLLGFGWGLDRAGGNFNQAVSADGLTGLVQTRGGGLVREEWDGSWALLAPDQPGVRVSYRSRFDAAGDGADVWRDFAADGRLDDLDDPRLARPGELIAGALCATVELAPGAMRTLPFVLAWDMPLTTFGTGTPWYKRYTRFYGTGGRAAWAIAADAAAQYPAWEAAIDAWQGPILADTTRPDWYKTALFNELYYLVDGGTFWENGQPPGVPARTGIPAAEGELGNFAFLECYDYPFYNTLDVNFYASFALTMLWPELEKQVMRDFAASVVLSDAAQVEIQSNGAQATRKVAGAVPHDLGGPDDDPLQRVNFYRYQDINIWKDLNSKFVLQLWRDYALTGDAALVQAAWPAVGIALAYLHQFDWDGDGLPDHAHVPDQTYDTWLMAGASAYSGGLWLAALEAALAMTAVTGDRTHAPTYAAWLATGRASYQAKLWNGRYYNYDSSGGPTADSIMADQLAGQWYADATGLPPIAPAAQVLTSLKTIFAFNVSQFGAGQMGAVNGMRPDGAIDVSSEHSQEVWTGTSYALAAFMLHRGLDAEAWHTAWGVYNVVYNRGYAFRTPEAYDRDDNFRASLYMRPLSIWAIEHALRQRAASGGHARA